MPVTGEVTQTLAAIYFFITPDTGVIEVEDSLLTDATDTTTYTVSNHKRPTLDKRHDKNRYTHLKDAKDTATNMVSDHQRQTLWTASHTE